MKKRIFSTIPLALVVAGLIFVLAFTRMEEEHMLAAESEVQVQIYPNILQIPADGAANAILVVQNSSTDTLENFELSYFPQGRIDIDFTNQGRDSVPPGSSSYWELKIEQKTPTLTTENIFLVIRYERQAEGDKPPLSAIAILSLEVSGTEVAIDQNLVAASTEMAEATVMEGHPATVYLLLQNTASGSLTVDSIRAESDSPLIITTEFSLPVTLEPFDQIAIPYIVEIEKSGAILPGKKLVLFNITAHTLYSQRRVLAVTSQEVNVGVVGENSILTLLGVPSLLILPGFLMLTTFQLLWRLKYGNVKFEVKSADFWLIAISLSMLAAIIYPGLTQLLSLIGILGQPRNYLHGYGLIDILALWITSILLAILVYILDEALRNRKIAARTPNAKDTAYTILSKLSKQGMGAVLDRVYVVTTSGETFDAFLLEPWSENMEKAWIGPGINLTWLADAPEIKKQVTSLLDKTGSADLKLLLRILKKGLRQKVLKLEWNSDAEPQKPRQVIIKEIRKKPLPLQFIQQELGD